MCTHKNNARKFINRKKISLAVLLGNLITVGLGPKERLKFIMCNFLEET